MFEENDVKSIGRSKPSERTPVGSFLDCRHMTVHELIACRDEITRHLPPLALKDLNLEEEMLLQFHAVRALQTDVLNNEEIPLNQRAQVANSVAATLNKLTEMQEAIYTTERFKSIEILMIRALNKLPEDVAEAFLVDYELTLGAK